jgi:hypothetical protein
MLPLLSLLAVIALAVLGWMLYQRVGADRIESLTEKRRATSRMVGCGEFVDGNSHQEVALALTASTFFYENGNMQASLDIDWLREIDYDDELSTGQTVDNGKVLRLRSDSRMFEFILPNDTVARWHMMLPPRRPQTARVSAPLPAEVVSATETA